MSAPSSIVIRQALIADLDLVVPLFDAYRQFYRQPSDLYLARRFIADRLAHRDSIIFLALDAQQAAAGFTQLYPSFSSVSAARIYILNDLFVAPHVRRQGVGAQLLTAAAEFARSAGAVRLSLSTENTNVDAQKLYRTEGWRQSTEYFYDLELPRVASTRSAHG